MPDLDIGAGLDSARCNRLAELRLSTTPSPPFPRSLIIPRLSWDEAFEVQAKVRALRRLAHTAGSDMDPEFRALFVRERRYRIAAFLVAPAVIGLSWGRSPGDRYAPADAPSPVDTVRPAP